MKIASNRFLWVITIIGLIWGASTNVTAQPKGKHKVTLDDLQSVKTIDFLSLAPEGDAVVYVTGEDLWLVATEPGSSPRKLGKGTLPLWSPDGKKVAYYSKASGTNQLWVRDMARGQAMQVTNLRNGIDPNPWTSVIGYSAGSATGALHYSWSPDSTRRIFAS